MDMETLALVPDILAEFDRSMDRLGVAGEQQRLL